MMTEKNKMECDDLLKTHEMTQKLLDANTADAAMLATLVQMARGGKDEMAMYMLHNLKPYAIEIAEALLSALFGEAIETRWRNPPSFFVQFSQILLGRSAHARRGPSFCQYTSCTNFSINLCAI